MRILDALKTQLRKFSGGTSIFVHPRSAGVYVNEEIALTYSAYWCAVHCIADSIAMMPWRLFAKKGKNREVMDQSDIDWIMYVQPNAEQTAFQFKQFLVASALSWGNGYAEIERDAGMRPIALWPLLSSHTKPFREEANGKLQYRVSQSDGSSVVLDASDVLHLAGLGYDGLVGYSVARMAARSIGTGLAQEQFGASFFANGTHPSGILTTDQVLNANQVEMQRKAWEETHGGPYKGGRTAILFGGIKYQPLTMPLDDAQFLESRKWSVREIARWFQLPPHKLGDLSDAKYANIEQQAIDFVQTSLMPWIVNLEQVANIKLVGRNNRGKLYTKFNVNALLRGDFSARSAAYREAIQNGWMSPNDVRELEDMNPIEDESAGKYYMQAQMTPIDLLTEKMEADIERIKNPPEPAIQPDGEPSTDAQTKNALRLMTR